MYLALDHFGDLILMIPICAGRVIGKADVMVEVERSFGVLSLA